jgi:putative ABC transport system permease protein
MSLYEFLGTLETGFIFAIVALGAYLTFKILDFPDLTVEGSFPLGAAVAATLIVGFGVNPWLATLLAGGAGFAAGFLRPISMCVSKSCTFWLEFWLGSRFTRSICE